jgi:alkanesulfonate monooxygenase SsuD/methylene tetrahydromethanopterin reductase-like flavin-dependent oxidoreductase (luciferase family)
MTGLRFGAMLLPRSLAATRQAVRSAEEAGFAWLGIGDSPAVYQDVSVHLVEAIHASERIVVAPMATHFVVRHPVVVANQLATLQELAPGRVAAVVATGNSGARGLRLAPATLAQLEAAIGCCRRYWAGQGGTWGDSVVPASGLARPATPLVVAGDGPRTVRMAARVADGVLYSGPIDPDTFAARAGEVGQAAGAATTPLPWAAGDRPELWVAVAASDAADDATARAELGAALVAIANRALRGGDLRARGIPDELHADVAAMRRHYDYAAHATFERPTNVEAMSDALARHLLGAMCVVGDERRWAGTLDRLAAAGADGVVFIVNQPDVAATIGRFAARLRRLGLLGPRQDPAGPATPGQGPS